MWKTGIVAISALLLGLSSDRLAAAPPAKGIALSSKHPRYWQYDGKPVLLLGGWNHGHNPFIDHDTDNDKDNQGVSTPAEITRAMDELAAAGGNYLRCVLDPGMASGIQGTPFCAKSGQRYDLGKMAGAFWQRLDFFLQQAGKRDIVVQIEVWDRFDLIDGSWGSWPVSPWNPKNNVNYTIASSGLAASYKSFIRHPFLQGVPGHPAYRKASRLRKQKYDVVRRFQDRFMDKLLSITLRYDNVLYCMNNETHEAPEWGQYWMNRIRMAARAKGKRVLTTDMFNDVYDPQRSAGLACQLKHRDKYDYVDASQVNSRHADQKHWDIARSIVKAAGKGTSLRLVHMTKIYGNDIALDKKPWSRFKPGDSDNAVEEWWRNLLAGVAGVRFHRPTAGIGLSARARACMAATRKVESKVKFWDVKPRQDLLTRREPDEAYLSADPGNAYILYFTQNGGGAVGLALGDYSGVTFELHWINIDSGKSGSSTTLKGGRTITVNRPDDSAHWVATIVRRRLGKRP